MMGPSLFLAVSIISYNVITPVLSKPLSKGQRSRVHEEVGTARRFRRDLHDSLPYEAEMMSYAPPEQLRNEVYYPELNEAMLARLADLQQNEKIAQALERAGFGGQDQVPERMLQNGGWEPDERLSQALQKMVEDGHRRDQEAQYLGNLLRLWNDMTQGKIYLDQAAVSQRPSPPENDFQSPYLDYDETAAVSNMVKPPMTKSQMNAQAAQALLNRYRQEGMYEAAQPQRLNTEEPDEDGDVDEEVLRYLVGRILTGMADSGGQRPLQRDSMPSRQEPYPVLKRTRRSVDEDHLDQANLLRVKRLGDGDDGYPGDLIPHQDPAYKFQGGLQRMKRIDDQLEEPSKSIRSRRYAAYDQGSLAERALKYLPE
ncbi:proSAAS-like [Protopterus annectens]|uniref:proSAAS-like n=1 Tax=Protopterus annectens TaxID=7888 RepID=UPI001CFB550D|nr:proSAAS-like [Protopterus annectens]